MPVQLPTYAVVFKTYTWDDFVCRQAQRCARATGRGEFYISLDETNGSCGQPSFGRLIRTSCAEMIALGLPDRFEHGSLLWWNADYAHYHFYSMHPEYDYYVFVEYDATVCGEFDAVVGDAVARGADMTWTNSRSNCVLIGP